LLCAWGMRGAAATKLGRRSEVIEPGDRGCGGAAVASDPPSRGFRLRSFAAGQDGATGEERVTGVEGRGSQRPEIGDQRSGGRRSEIQVTGGRRQGMRRSRSDEWLVASDEWA